VALNVPAIIMAMPPLLIFSALGSSENPVLVGLTVAFFVYVLWFFIGRWLDRQLGRLPTLPPPLPDRMTWWLNWVAVLGCGALAVFFLYRWRQPPAWQEARHTSSLFAAVWLVIGALAFGARIRRWTTIEKAQKKGGGFEIPL
jgi:peptidoglycan/LPS O-acetylase OafA/YrhL